MTSTDSMRAVPDLSVAGTFADTVHEYIREYIQLADAKAAFISTIATALLALFYQQGMPKLFLKNIFHWTAESWASFLATLLLVGTVAAALAVVVPRRKGPRSGLVFWEAIADHASGHAYAESVLVEPAADLVRQKLYHCYALSKVCRRKYIYLDAAVRLGALALFAALLLLATRVTNGA